LAEFITNLVRVKPNEDEISVLLVQGIQQRYWSRIVRVVNEYTDSFVAAGLFGDREYRGLNPGVYITSIGKTISKSEFMQELSDAINKYYEVIAKYERYKKVEANKQIPEEQTSNDIEEFKQSVNKLISGEVLEDRNIGSKSYIAARLLNNFLDKKIKRLVREGKISEESLCKGDVNVRVCIRLDVDSLKNLMGNKGGDPLFDFCEDYPGLCRKEEDGCHFFNVVKQFNVLFQHSEDEESNERIYLVFHSRYRRVNYLHLKDIIEFLLSKRKERITQDELSKVLKGVRVNVKSKKGWDEDTELYEIESVKYTENADIIVELKHVEDKRNKMISLNDETYEIKINPTYKSSRDFIEKYLCPSFDRHKKLSQIGGNRYLRILKRDFVIFKRFLMRYGIIDEQGGINLGGITYMIRDTFVKV